MVAGGTSVGVLDASTVTTDCSAEIGSLVTVEVAVGMGVAVGGIGMEVGVCVGAIGVAVSVTCSVDVGCIVAV